MKNAPLFRLAAMLSLAIPLASVQVQAQTMATDADRFTVRISGLTSTTRDAITRDADPNGSLRVVFACVPAGLLVFESTNSASHEHLREQALPLLRHRAEAALITEVSLGLQQAEAECAQARNR